MREDKELDKIKNQLSVYSNEKVSSAIKGIASLVPYIGGTVSELVNYKIQSNQKKKREEFLNYINDSNNYITIDMVNDEEFIMNFMKTLDAVNRLSQNDKIKYFANLLKNGYFKEEKIIQDEFDEYFYIIHTLSNRELIILSKIYDYTVNYPRNDEKKVDHENWNIIKNNTLEELLICSDQYDSSIEKISSMGIIKINKTWGYLKGTSITGYVTPHFNKFVDIVIKK